MMNDSSRDGRLYWVVQRSPEEKPEVYRYRCCVGWFMSRLNSSCKSLFQVHVNGQKGMRDTGNLNAVEIQIRLEVHRQRIDANSQCAGAAYDCCAM